MVSLFIIMTLLDVFQRRWSGLNSLVNSLKHSKSSSKNKDQTISWVDILVDGLFVLQRIIVPTAKIQYMNIKSSFLGKCRSQTEVGIQMISLSVTMELEEKAT